MMGWVTFSLSERLRFPFCWYLLKGKHVRCLITVWHLTVFSDQSDVAFFIYIYIFMLAIWRNGNKEKKTVLSLSSSLSKASFQHSYQHQIPRVLCSFFPLLFVFIFSSRSFWTSPVRRDLIATIRAQEKSLSGVKKCQPPKGPAKSQLDRWKQLEDASDLVWKASSAPRDREPSPLHLSPFLRFGSLLTPPFGHCRYIFLYRFRICSTVNYQLYVILEERRRAAVKQQSHQSLWLHNSCHPYSNKIYHIVNHQDANVRRVCVCVCARRSADNSEVIN